MPTDRAGVTALLAEAEALLERITQGDWYWWMSEGPPWQLGTSAQHPAPHMGVTVTSSPSDAEFMASSPRLVRALCAALRESQQREGKQPCGDKWKAFQCDLPKGHIGMHRMLGILKQWASEGHQ